MLNVASKLNNLIINLISIIKSVIISPITHSVFIASKLNRSWLFIISVDLLNSNHHLVDPASSHMLVSKIKPCMSKYKPLYGETANGSLKQL